MGRWGRWWWQFQHEPIIVHKIHDQWFVTVYLVDRQGQIVPNEIYRCHREIEARTMFYKFKGAWEAGIRRP